ncbi:relaxase/mobilization nuclease domain-containing protein [Kitasatospora sp. NPDC098663]|uniref:relaxase/mobilization nuclease domain-containing protein n=1 Tax=Kitasatospora sp. NPDC098663 TaxID=3364096 RepID=UPI0037F2B267
MIGNITTGRRVAGAIRYDFGPGRRDEHLDPRFVAGTVPGTPQQVARLIDHHTRQRSDIKKPIWRVSLSVPDEDGVLDDRVWAAVAEKYVARMGFGDCPWVAARHGHDHVHITVSRLTWDGRLIDNGRDWLRNRTVLDALEAEHGLVRAADRYKKTGPGVRSGSELAAAQRRGAVLPEREQIRVLAQQARDAAAGLGRVRFEAELTARGVDFRANVASTGRMNGYSLSIPAWLDSDGVQIWVPASRAGRDLAWGKLGPVLDPPAELRLVTGPVAPLADDDSVTAAPVSAPPPDLARSRLAEARERAAERAADQRAEAVRALGAIPAGTVLDLDAALRTLRTTLDTREKTLSTETATAMRLDGLASGVGMGAHRSQLHQHRAGLQAAVAAEAEAEAYTTEAGQQRQQASADRQVQAEAEAKAGSRWRSPRAKADAGNMATAAADLAARAETEAVRLDRAAETALRRAEEAAPGVRGPYAEALAALESSWQQEERAAIRQDAQLARLQEIDHQAPLQAARVSVAQARRGVEQLLAEQARRAALPPEQLRLEDQVRADLAREVTARAVRAGSTTARPTKKATAKKAVPKKAGPAVGQQPPYLRRGDPRDRGGAPGR